MILLVWLNRFEEVSSRLGRSWVSKRKPSWTTRDKIIPTNIHINCTGIVISKEFLAATTMIPSGSHPKNGLHPSAPFLLSATIDSLHVGRSGWQIRQVHS